MIRPRMSERWDVGNRAGLLMAWLAEEGERRRRPSRLPLRVGDPGVRGLVHVLLCLLIGVVAGGLFLCWHGGARPRWDQVNKQERLREDWMAEAACGPGAAPGRGR